MAQVLQVDDMADAVLATLNKLNRNKWIGEMTDLQEHVGFYAMARDKKERVDGGRGIVTRYVMDHNSSASRVGLFNNIEYARDDAVVEGTVPFRWIDGHILFDEREHEFNSGADAVFDLLKVENARMLTSMVELAEGDIWTKPESSSDNDQIFGVDYWVVKNATLGFNGADPSGFTSGRAGVSSTTYPRHKNFTGQYTDISDTTSTGLVYQMEQAADQCRWIAPAPEPGMGRSGYSRGIYCQWSVKNGLKNVAKSNNDSLGFDLSTQEPVFRGAKIRYTPYFDDSTDYPLYMLDHNHIYAVFLKDWYMKKCKVDRLPNQPHCFAIVTSMGLNITSDDPRRQAVFYK